MKIRNPTLVRFAGWSSTKLIKLLFKTVRKQYLPQGLSLIPENRDSSERSIYSIWHENLLLPSVMFGRNNIAVLISQHADGRILDSLIASMGMESILGSTTRNAINALRHMINEQATWQHLAVTPDGPRGPRRQVQQGIIYIASKTGMTIVPVGVGYRRPFRAKSWDCFAIPKPFSKAVLVTGEKISIPPVKKMTELEAYRLLVQNEMERLNEIAEQIAETGQKQANNKPSSA